MTKAAMSSQSKSVMSPQERALFDALKAARPGIVSDEDAIQIVRLTDLPPTVLSQWGERNASRMKFCPSYRSMSDLAFSAVYLDTMVGMEDQQQVPRLLYQGKALILRTGADAEGRRERAILAICEAGDTNLARNTANISFAADAQIEGTGLMSLFVSECIDQFRMSGLRRITAEVAEGNDRSARLLHRLGFVHEGLLRLGEVVEGQPVDLHLWGKLL